MIIHDEPSSGVSVNDDSDNASMIINSDDGDSTSMIINSIDGDSTSMIINSIESVDSASMIYNDSTSSLIEKGHASVDTFVASDDGAKKPTAGGLGAALAFMRANVDSNESNDYIKPDVTDISSTITRGDKLKSIKESLETMKASTKAPEESPNEKTNIRSKF